MSSYPLRRRLLRWGYIVFELGKSISELLFHKICCVRNFHIARIVERKWILFNNNFEVKSCFYWWFFFDSCIRLIIIFVSNKNFRFHYSRVKISIHSNYRQIDEYPKGKAVQGVREAQYVYGNSQFEISNEYATFRERDSPFGWNERMKKFAIVSETYLLLSVYRLGVRCLVRILFALSIFFRTHCVDMCSLTLFVFLWIPEKKNPCRISY